VKIQKFNESTDLTYKQKAEWLAELIVERFFKKSEVKNTEIRFGDSHMNGYDYELIINFYNVYNFTIKEMMKFRKWFGEPEDEYHFEADADGDGPIVYSLFLLVFQQIDDLLEKLETEKDSEKYNI